MTSPAISVGGLTRRYRGQLAAVRDGRLLAALAAILLAGGLTTVRGVTV